MLLSGTPSPRPSRALRLAVQQAERLERQTARLQESRRKQAKWYGAGPEKQESWPAFKERIKVRDGRRCIVRDCTTPRLGLEIHHQKTVSSGGRNDERNACVLCAFCHEQVNDANGRVRGIVREYLALHYLPADHEIDATEGLDA